MSKKVLKNITLISVDTFNYGKAVSSLQKSMEQCDFGAVKFLTDIPIELEGIEVVQISKLDSKIEYSQFVIKELYKYIDTDYVLITQHDSWVLNGDCWDDEFYNYDYLGAAWLFPDNHNVGNGGFSARTKRLMEIVAKDDLIVGTDPEDNCLCRTYRNYLEDKYDIKFPSNEVADKFAFELREPNQKTFGFHGYFHQPYSPTIIISRSAALGDCVLLEPIMRYYAVKGYNVVLNIPLQFFDLYTNHYFHVKHISQFDKGRIKPEKEINLDMSYESKQNQNYLKSYFEFCGITDYQLSRPQLFPLVNEETKLFKKYACIHIDNRVTVQRNIYGVNWKSVQRYLENLGYVVLQVGRNEHESCGIEINTPTVAFMKFVVAGCDLFIGVDSSPAHIAIAYNKPCVLLFGASNPDYIHADLRGVEVIQGECEKANCWHYNGSTEGKKCAFEPNTNEYLQCCKSDSDQVIDAINRLIKR